MYLDLNPLRFGAMFAPIWLLMAPSLWLYWDQWAADPILAGLIGGMPLIAGGLAATVLRHRWRLEINRKGLIHHTLVREEVFEWSRMGPLSVQRRGPMGFFSALVFAYPIDAEAPQEIISKHLGRSILAIFGDQNPGKIAAFIETQRQAFTAKGRG